MLSVAPGFLLTNPATELPVLFVSTVLYLGVLIRFGMLASAGFMLVSLVDQFAVLSLDFSVWYAWRMWLFATARPRRWC